MKGCTKPTTTCTHLPRTLRSPLMRRQSLWWGTRLTANQVGVFLEEVYVCCELLLDGLAPGDSTKNLELYSVIHVNKPNGRREAVERLVGDGLVAKSAMITTVVTRKLFALGNFLRLHGYCLQLWWRPSWGFNSTMWEGAPRPGAPSPCT